MREINACSRFCQQCSKVVHDLTGKRVAEVEQIFLAAGGDICMTFSVDDQGNPILGDAQPSPRKPIYLRHLAAAASLILIYHSPQAEPIAIVKPRTELVAGGGKVDAPTGKTNTLVTGVIVKGLGESIRDSLMVRILKDGELIAKGYSSYGLFHFDLAGKFSPEDTLVIQVKGRKFDLGQPYRERSYGSAEQTVSLGNAQNICITVTYDPAKRPPFRTGGVPRFR